MEPLVECVPNFSEGRNRTTVQALIDAVASVTGVRVLDHTMDRDHHRCVLTFVGEPEGMIEAAFRAILVATDLIDLRQHSGAHPRVGAADVVPFVPIRGATMQDCVQLAKRLGQRVGQELDIPVFLYERAASHPDHAALESVRRGGLEGLAYRLASDPDWSPDFGPAHLHKTAGAIVIGARQPLIAFNVNLHSKDLTVAQSIAKAIRQSNGGIPHLKAIGVELASRRMVQVAMNLTDYQETPIHVAFEAVQAQAALHGVEIAGSEIIGLVPQSALVEAAVDALRLDHFDPAQVLETRIETALSSEGADHMDQAEFGPKDLRRLSVSQLLDAVAAATPVPAGGAVAALAGALAGSLGLMAARLSQQHATEHRLDEIGRRLSDLLQADGEAYRTFIEATRLPKSDPDRPTALSSALHVATEIPLEIAERSADAGALLHACSGGVKSRVRSDLKVGLFMALAAGEAGVHTAKENLKLQPNQRLRRALQPRILRVSQYLEDLKCLCYTPPLSQRGAGKKLAQASPGKVRKRNEWKSKSSITTSKKRSKLRRQSSRGKGSSGN
ncbi:MAG TPA: glutamate formimidoyltransferase [Nitrospira sp.]|nr:glutamate formimidoyltransferase [Nitrospira sp.]